MIAVGRIRKAMQEIAAKKGDFTLSGYPFHSAVGDDSVLVGRSPGPRGTPPSRCRTRRQGLPRGRGRPPCTTSRETSG